MPAMIAIMATTLALLVSNQGLATAQAPNMTEALASLPAGMNSTTAQMPNRTQGVPAGMNFTRPDGSTGGNLTEPPPPDTIAGVAFASNLTTLFAALLSVGGPILEAARNSSSEVTVFAPTNYAFKTALRYLNTTEQEFNFNESLVQLVLSYHIVPRVVRSTEATVAGIVLPTMLGADRNITFLKRGSTKSSTKYYVTGEKTRARVIEADIPAGGSIIHVINKVLLPDLTRP